MLLRYHTLLGMWQKYFDWGNNLMMLNGWYVYVNFAKRVYCSKTISIDSAKRFGRIIVDVKGDMSFFISANYNGGCIRNEWFSKCPNVVQYQLLFLANYISSNFIRFKTLLLWYIHRYAYKRKYNITLHSITDLDILPDICVTMGLYSLYIPRASVVRHKTWPVVGKRISSRNIP